MKLYKQLSFSKVCNFSYRQSLWLLPLEAENPSYTTGFNIHSIFTKTTIYCLGTLGTRGLSLCIALMCQIKTYNKWHKTLFKTSVINRLIFWKISVLNLEVLDTVKVYIFFPPQYIPRNCCNQMSTGHNHFLPHSFQFTIHKSYYQWMPHNLYTWKAVIK